MKNADLLTQLRDFRADLAGDLADPETTRLDEVVADIAAFFSKLPADTEFGPADPDTRTMLGCLPDVEEGRKP